MSEARGGGGRGRGRGGGRGGRGGAAGGGAHQEKPKKENILDLNKYMGKSIRIQFVGGREVVGTLRGHDQLMNLVLDEADEVGFDFDEDEGKYAESKRHLGICVARGPLLTLISPEEGRVQEEQEAEDEDDEDDEDEDEDEEMK